MFERKISKADIRSIIENGEIVEDYPDDSPYPSKLLLGFLDSRPVHMVLAYNEKEEMCIIVTAYEPSKKNWNEDFKTRRT